ncbi:diacylglycerol/lipid kinase family protein [Microbacterium rhizophilus]|uniref:diacylglycerol/lipid kinase family protein n=1 Tax=Microbacterium rhizophilus TaxID=3138934 RepID=UPI0031E6941A
MSIDLASLRSAVTAEEERSGWLPSIWVETAVRSDGRVARAVRDHQPALVLIAGGDGTIRSVVDEIHPSAVPVALVPGGTGNLLARNLGLVGDTELAVRDAFSTGATRAIDVGRIRLDHPDGHSQTRVFLVMTGVGLDARMASDTSSALKKRVGWLAYVEPISRSVLRGERFLMRYRVDGDRERSVHAHTVIVGNCGTLTGGMVLLPAAVVDDGLLDVVLFRPRGFWQWLRVGTRLGIGGLLHRTRRGRAVLRATADLHVLPYVQAATLTARFDRPESIELDGDSFGTVLGVTVSVHPGALHVRVPRV